MDKRSGRFDPEEKFSLHSLEGEDVLKKLLGTEKLEDKDSEDEGDSKSKPEPFQREE